MREARGHGDHRQPDERCRVLGVERAAPPTPTTASWPPGRQSSGQLDGALDASPFHGVEAAVLESGGELASDLRALAGADDDRDAALGEMPPSRTSAPSERIAPLLT